MSATLNGLLTTRVEITVPTSGPWWADVDLAEVPSLSGLVTLDVGGANFVGAVVSAQSGTHMRRARVRIVGGRGGWGVALRARHYHADNGLRLATVALDAALECGETISLSSDLPTRIGVDYVRDSGPASRALEDVLGAATWWVDYDGVTYAAPSRPTHTPTRDSYEVLEHDPRQRIVTIATDDVTSVRVGSTLSSERLDADQTVRELSILVESDAVRIVARCGDLGSRGMLAGLFRSLVGRATDGRLFGTWRYRVVRLSGDRLELQSVRRAAGVPDVLPVSIWPGIAGAHSEPTLGAEVLVGFIEGDRSMPYVAAFAGKDGIGHTAQTLTLSTSSEVRIGGPGASTPLAKAPDTEARFNLITDALNAYAAAAPIANDGGAALQAALKAAWGASPQAHVSIAAPKAVVE